MKKEKVYVVNVQFYGDWSWECGSNDIVGIYSNLESALQAFRKTLEHELFEDNDRIIENEYKTITQKSNIASLKELLDSVRKTLENGSVSTCVSEYINEDYYHNGNNSASIEIKVMDVE